MPGLADDLSDGKRVERPLRPGKRPSRLYKEQEVRAGFGRGAARYGAMRSGLKRACFRAVVTLAALES